MNKLTVVVAAGLLAGGCATSYDLKLMPRDSGTVYSGIAENRGGGEGRISVTIENKTYNGTWVEAVPHRSTGFVTGGFGRWGRFGGFGSTVTIENPGGGIAKALLNAADGSGLRCDFQSGGWHGGGLCRDDRGREYDVQIRPVPARG